MNIDSRNKFLSEGNQQFFSSFADDQQRRFTGTKLHVFHAADRAPVIEDCASDQVADVSRPGFNLGPLFSRNLYLAADQRFGVVDTIDTRKLQDYITLMRPVRFQPQLAPLPIRIQSKQLLPLGELLGEIGVQFCSYFTVASLGLDHARDGDEFLGCRAHLAYSSSTMSSE